VQVGQDNVLIENNYEVTASSYKFDNGGSSGGGEVKKTSSKRQVAGRDYTHESTCLICWDGGNVILCDRYFVCVCVCHWVFLFLLCLFLSFFFFVFFLMYNYMHTCRCPCAYHPECLGHTSKDTSVATSAVWSCPHHQVCVFNQPHNCIFDFDSNTITSHCLSYP
jgi:hypothetical protein